ncbi:glycoside hydrolase N-terminal domain-containing protein [Nonomuraea jabiensis]|uniref:glycoside hydrolase N-terminal domain-containing protein n=1 Tax=Nonomuraea jabiensis TaxID=882448 RepID=UPI00342D443A
MTDLTLWYDRPATDWETQALPIGNGALGAMVFGGTGTERLQFNEKSLWTGGPGSREGYDFGDWSPPRPDALARVQEALDRDGRMAPQEVAAALEHAALRGHAELGRPGGDGVHHPGD